MIKVWDPVVRIFHWGTAAAFLINFWVIEDGDIHEWLGYGVACLLFYKGGLGLRGEPTGSVLQFFPTPSRLKRYIHALLQGKHEPTVGHNPMGGLMILALMFLLAGITLTGWFMTLDMFWGVPWPEEVHDLLATITQGLVFVHVAVALLMDLFFKEGLVRAMITGKKNQS